MPFGDPRKKRPHPHPWVAHWRSDRGGKVWGRGCIFICYRDGLVIYSYVIHWSYSRAERSRAESSKGPCLLEIPERNGHTHTRGLPIGGWTAAEKYGGEGVYSYVIEIEPATTTAAIAERSRAEPSNSRAEPSRAESSKRPCLLQIPENTGDTHTRRPPLGGRTAAEKYGGDGVY